MSFFEKPKSLKRRFHDPNSFINWILGNLITPLGVCIATKSGFGLSMIGAGPYILHVWLREAQPWFTQGTAEYFYEFFVMILVCIIVRQCKLKYMMVFVEALITGFIIDGWFKVLGGNGVYTSMQMRIIALFLGIIVTALGVAFFFRTSLPLQAYDFAVVKISTRYDLKQSKVKWISDFTLLAIALVLSFALTGQLTGIGIGTILTTFLNAPVIALWGKLIDKFQKEHPLR